LTARTNDEGWQTVFSEWLKVSQANTRDAIFILSVGGGNVEKNVSANIVAAIIEAKKRGLRVLGIVGRDGGYTKRAGDAVVVVPTVEECRVTPHVEAFQTVVWHCLVSHPRLQLNATKW
jgi:D-sedoheptulose 7-phosphate isomerase